MPRQASIVDMPLSAWYLRRQPNLDEHIYIFEEVCVGSHSTLKPLNTELRLQIAEAHQKHYYESVWNCDM